jgi:peptide deformylase
MTIAKVVTFKHPSLREVCLEETEFDLHDLTTLRDEMVATMKQYSGVGIAAPQLGYQRRVICVMTSRGLYLMVNPKIVESSGSITRTEGCLSIPGVYGEVTRSQKITVMYKDRYSNKCCLTFEGMDAIIIQHEIDHLDGILFIDKASNIRFEDEPK